MDQKKLEEAARDHDGAHRYALTLLQMHQELSAKLREDIGLSQTAADMGFNIAGMASVVMNAKKYGAKTIDAWTAMAVADEGGCIDSVIDEFLSGDRAEIQVRRASPEEERAAEAVRRKQEKEASALVSDALAKVTGKG